VYNFDLENIIISIIAVTIAIALIGINVLGTGLQNESIHIIYKVLAYYFIWAIISIFTFDIFASIPVLGTTFYMIFTILYGISILGNVSE